MKNSTRLWRYFVAIPLFALQGMIVTASSRAACYSTPRIAVDGFTKSPSIFQDSKNGGYRVSRIELDSVLGVRWAMVASCDHPEWPAFAVSTNATNSMPLRQESGRPMTENVKTVPVVRAGEIVRLWRQENLLRIEVAAVSEENGCLGKTVRVRLLRGSTDDQSIPEQFSGVVRGPSDVEMQPR
jgi:hypothetical protein